MYPRGLEGALSSASGLFCFQLFCKNSAHFLSLLLSLSLLFSWVNFGCVQCDVCTKSDISFLNWDPCFNIGSNSLEPDVVDHNLESCLKAGK